MNENTANTAEQEVVGSALSHRTARPLNKLGQRLIRTPWASSGADISLCASVDDAITEASLNWQVGLQDAFIAGDNKVDGIPVIGKKIGGVKAVQRLDNNDIIGNVGCGYSPIQNAEMFGVFDGIVETGLATFDRAGCLASNHYGAGSRVFFSARMNQSTDVGNDKLHTFVYGKSGHDGGLSYIIALLDYVETCSNGMIGMRKHNSLSIRHTLNGSDRLEEARMVIGFAEAHQVWLSKICDDLFNAPMTVDEMKHFTEQLMPPTLDSEGNPRVSGRLKNKREKVIDLFATGIGQAERGQTRWAAMNAVTEFVDHSTKYSSRLKDDATARHDAVLEGSGSGLKDRALELLSV